MKYTNQIHNRRTFLKTLGVCAAGAVVAPTLHVLPAYAAPGMVKTSEQRMLMGTFVGVTVLASSRAHGEEAIGRAFTEVERHIALFSRFDQSTPLSVLNQDGRLNNAPPELIDVFTFSNTLHHSSGKRFDVTIAPVINLLERTGGKPAETDLREALALVNGSRLRVKGSQLRLDGTGMAVTLDGVAKGYIADRTAEALRKAGVTNFLIDAGGDIRTHGAADGQLHPWRVAIEDPDKLGNHPAVLSLTSGAVATSGGYEVFFNPSKTAHHLVNPYTGISPQYIRSVSVTAPTVMQADGLATALSLMSPREALHLVNSMPDHSCLILTSTGAALPSHRWA